ncbi:hypothetical protein CAI21_18720 [Alkalilimnicola ehrlichii]|uniref:Outer membrane efflux protein n=1 Tax=Alkalilimnicola ehrlichii TaxID=351052 RepID=A0A3E0WJQ4_9GAMM|nr:TolC family protein [Alkalilimnicola ehrlichii]RFA25562.1 hypothetical protein CAI21_18720 [Alkalilimnicola ehrlichii]RFA32689.1 hypothetical protein CAL65_18975 [Alkalilimnicola ehrlichii]
MRKKYLSDRARRVRPVVLIASLALAVPIVAAAESWSLERSVARAVDVSPAYAASRAAVLARQGDLAEAGRWPNPAVEITLGDGLGRELGAADWRGQEYAVSQTVPLGGRLREQRRAVARDLAATQAQADAAALDVEYAAASAFHQLQWAREQVLLAQAQRERTREFRRIGQRRAAAGDLSSREELRLELLAAEAEAALEDATREVSAARLRLLALLDLPAEHAFEPRPLTRPASPPTLDELLERQREHPAARIARERFEAASARRAEARAARLPDLELRVTREEEVFDGRRQAAYSVGLQVELPLWRSGLGRLEASSGEVLRTQEELRLTQRDRHTALAESHGQLARLLERSARHQSAVLERSQQVLTLTEQGYAAGELALAELIDAAQANWGAARQQLDLLLQANLHEAQLRHAAGLRLTTH